MKKLEVRTIKIGYGTNSSSYSKYLPLMDKEKYEKFKNGDIAFIHEKHGFYEKTDPIFEKYNIKYDKKENKFYFIGNVHSIYKKGEEMNPNKHGFIVLSEFYNIECDETFVEKTQQSTTNGKETFYKVEYDYFN